MGWLLAIAFVLVLFVLFGMSGYYFAGVRLRFVPQSIIAFSMACCSAFAWYFELARPHARGYVAQLPGPFTVAARCALFVAETWIPLAVVGWIIGWAVRRKRGNGSPQK